MTRSKWISVLVVFGLTLGGCLGSSTSGGGGSEGGSLTCSGSNGDWSLCVDYVGSTFNEIGVRALCSAQSSSSDSEVFSFSSESCPTTRDGLTRTGTCKYAVGEVNEYHYYYYGADGAIAGAALCSAGSGGTWEAVSL